jgi:hypothetical protein
MRTPTLARFLALWALVALASACAGGRPPALDPHDTAEVLEASGATAGALAACVRARDEACVRRLSELLEYAGRLAKPGR